MDTKTPAPAILQTKQHFEILDGLRGIAALSVVTFHFMEWVYSDYSQNFIGHGFLAVDFFFCLSGFVIGYAYDDRIGKMGILEFFKSRIIRLHPLVIRARYWACWPFCLIHLAVTSNYTAPGRSYWHLFALCCLS